MRRVLGVLQASGSQRNCATKPEFPFSILNRISTDSGRFANAEFEPGLSPKSFPARRNGPVCGELLILGKSVIRHTHVGSNPTGGSKKLLLNGGVEVF